MNGWFAEARTGFEGFPANAHTELFGPPTTGWSQTCCAVGNLDRAVAIALRMSLATRVTPSAGSVDEMKKSSVTSSTMRSGATPDAQREDTAFDQPSKLGSAHFQIAPPNWKRIS